MRDVSRLRYLPLLAVPLLVAACADTSSKTVALMCGSKQIEVTFSFSDGAAKPVEMRFPLADGTPAVATFSGDPGAPTIMWPMAEEVFLSGSRPRSVTVYTNGQFGSISGVSVLFDDGRACVERR